MNGHLRGVAAAALGALIWLAPAPATADTPDTWITTKAKIALLTADGVSATDVNVDSKDGNVVIHGKVASAAEKAKAEATVRKLDGVKNVQNLLQVVPDARRDSVQATDDQIEQKVESALKSKGLDDVKVSSVNQGVVLLSGKTDAMAKELAAIEAALLVPGVKRVATEIELKK